MFVADASRGGVLCTLSASVIGIALLIDWSQGRGGRAATSPRLVEIGLKMKPKA